MSRFIFKKVLKSKFTIFALSIVLIISVFTIYLFFGPIFTDLSRIEKISYQESQNKFLELAKEDNESINEKCKSILMDHGKITGKAIVFYHGYTNCPEQFRTLGETFYKLGYNVLIPRIPKHGEKNRLTDSLSSLTPHDLTDFIIRTTKIATGLGESVYTAGISGGAVLAAASAYSSDYIEKTLIISPLFLPYDLQEWGLNPFIKIRNFMPLDYIRWWDLEKKENIAGPDYAYPRFSFKGTMSFLEIGKALTERINTNSKLRNNDLQIIHIYSENDIAVNNGYNIKILQKWANNTNKQLITEMFSKDFAFNHDIIDLNQPSAKKDIVYPIIIKLAENQK